MQSAAWRARSADLLLEEGCTDASRFANICKRSVVFHCQSLRSFISASPAESHEVAFLAGGDICCLERGRCICCTTVTTSTCYLLHAIVAWHRGSVSGNGSMDGIAKRIGLTQRAMCLTNAMLALTDTPHWLAVRPRTADDTGSSVVFTAVTASSQRPVRRGLCATVCCHLHALPSFNESGD